MIAQPQTSDLPLDGIFNFRDFGGWPTRDGGRVRPGLLFRSAHHAQATPEDLQRLADLGIELIVDLRRPPERRRDPSRRPPGFSGRVIQHDDGPDDESLAPHLEFLAHPDASLAWVNDWMISGYQSYPWDPIYSNLYRSYFHALAQIDGPVLVHCHAGKDRTGVLCALTLHALGVERSAIYEDYLATNRMNRADLRLDTLSRAFERNHGRPPPSDLLRQVMTADASYLDAAFAEVEARHGDVAGYLESVLGVTPGVLAALRARLVERP
jgi:protein tyrosine/serine phosphatase